MFLVGLEIGPRIVAGAPGAVDLTSARTGAAVARLRRVGRAFARVGIASVAGVAGIRRHATAGAGRVPTATRVGA